MPEHIAPLVHGTFYHIYNRGNNRENIFPQERNYANTFRRCEEGVCPDEAIPY